MIVIEGLLPSPHSWYRDFTTWFCQPESGDSFYLCPGSWSSSPMLGEVSTWGLLDPLPWLVTIPILEGEGSLKEKHTTVPSLTLEPQVRDFAWGEKTVKQLESLPELILLEKVKPKGILKNSGSCSERQLGGNLSSVGQESVWNAGDLGLIPGSGRSLGKGKGYPLQYSGLENSMDCIVHVVTKSWTRLSNFHFHFQTSRLGNL